MGRLSEIFKENNAEGGSESLTLEERIVKLEQMLTKLTEALIGGETVETETETETTETIETVEREDEEE